MHVCGLYALLKYNTVEVSADRRGSGSSYITGPIFYVHIQTTVACLDITSCFIFSLSLIYWVFY